MKTLSSKLTRKIEMFHSYGDKHVTVVAVDRTRLRLGVVIDDRDDYPSSRLELFTIAAGGQYTLIDALKAFQPEVFTWDDFERGETQRRSDVRERLCGLGFDPAMVDRTFPKER